MCFGDDLDNEAIPRNRIAADDRVRPDGEPARRHEQPPQAPRESRRRAGALPAVYVSDLAVVVSWMVMRLAVLGELGPLQGGLRRPTDRFGGWPRS
jgi:hypothetical protein